MKSAGVAAKPAVFPNHPVTRDDDGQRVLAVGVADRARSFGVADGRSQPLVASRVAKRDGSQFTPDFPLEWGSLTQIQGTGKPFQFAGKEKVKLSFKVFEFLFYRCVAIGFSQVIAKSGFAGDSDLDATQSGKGGCDANQPQGTGENNVMNPGCIHEARGFGLQKEFTRHDKFIK